MNAKGAEEELELPNGNNTIDKTLLKSEWLGTSGFQLLNKDSHDCIGTNTNAASLENLELQSCIDIPRGITGNTESGTPGKCEDNLHGLSIRPMGQSYEPNIPTAEDILQQITSRRRVAAADTDVLSHFNQSCRIADHHVSPEFSMQPGNTLPSLQHHPESIANGATSFSSAEDITLPIEAPYNPVWVTRTDISQTSNEEPTTVTSQQFDSTVETSTQSSVPDKPEQQRDSYVSETTMSSIIQIPGPCEAEDLIEGIIFSASYLGTTQLPLSRNGVKNSRMLQAQEALNRIKVADGESQPSVLVDLFISTAKIKILDANNQQSMMSHSLRSISYVADIGDLLVVMAKPQPTDEGETEDQDSDTHKDTQRRPKVLCHVLCSEDSHLISGAVGQCFRIAYQQFLTKNSIKPENLSQSDFSQFLDTQDMYHDDLLHYSKEENVKEIWVEKSVGENMGIAIVESGWGSIIPTVILANLQHGSPIERNGKFSIGDQIMSIDGTSLVGLPLQTCHSIIKGLRSQTKVKINIVSCPPVVSVLIKRPSLNDQLGFSVQNGVICSLMRGGIAERGGVRVGHRIIEINHKSVVATPHDKIVQMLVTSVGEIQMKTMPSSMYRLLTGQEQPIFL